jgi:tRNA(fMet)-specific endonuclease VapC
VKNGPQTFSSSVTIKHGLKRAGTALPLNDVWIAAHALETGAVLATFDAHFHKIPGLRLCDLD